MPVMYLAGPITGVPNYKERFHAVAQALRMSGWQVMNPAELPDGMTEQQYMDIGLAMVRGADAVLLLNGSMNSAGAQCEQLLAQKCGKHVYWEDLHLAELILAKVAQ